MFSAVLFGPCRTSVPSMSLYDCVMLLLLNGPIFYTSHLCIIYAYAYFLYIIQYLSPFPNVLNNFFIVK